MTHTIPVSEQIKSVDQVESELATELSSVESALFVYTCGIFTWLIIKTGVSLILVDTHPVPVSSGGDTNGLVLSLDCSYKSFEALANWLTGRSRQAQMYHTLIELHLTVKNHDASTSEHEPMCCDLDEELEAQLCLSIDSQGSLTKNAADTKSHRTGSMQDSVVTAQN